MKVAASSSAWKLTPAQAIALQQELANRVVERGSLTQVRFVAGLDASFSPDGRFCLGAVVLWDRRTGQVVEQHTAQEPLRFPYIPGLLSFREAPTLLVALEKLTQPADLLMCDGQGRAHPRRFGLACHLGVLCDLPAIGCAKSRLVGEHAEVGPIQGNQVRLRCRGEVVGAVVRTRSQVRPVYVSVGHRMSLAQAVAWVLACTTRYRLPEPTRLADKLTKQVRQAGESLGD